MKIYQSKIKAIMDILFNNKENIQYIHRMETLSNLVVAEVINNKRAEKVTVNYRDSKGRFSRYRCCNAKYKIITISEKL